MIHSQCRSQANTVYPPRKGVFHKEKEMYNSSSDLNLMRLLMFFGELVVLPIPYLSD